VTIITKNMSYSMCFIALHNHVIMDVLNDYQLSHGWGFWCCANLWSFQYFHNILQYIFHLSYCICKKILANGECCLWLFAHECELWVCSKMLQMFHIASSSLVVFHPLFDCHLLPINNFCSFHCYYNGITSCYQDWFGFHPWNTSISSFFQKIVHIW